MNYEADLRTSRIQVSSGAHPLPHLLPQYKDIKTLIKAKHRSIYVTNRFLERQSVRIYTINLEAKRNASSETKIVLSLYNLSHQSEVAKNV